MITINLLPKDIQVQGQGPATSQFFVFLGSGCFAMIACLAFLWFHFRALPYEQAQLQDLRTQRTNLKKFEDMNADLKATIKNFENHQQAIERCRDQRRVMFSKKLHELSSIVLSHQKVWLSELSIAPKVSDAKGGGGKLQFTWAAGCTCVDDKLETATAFHELIWKRSPAFFKDFIQINVPRYTRKELVVGDRKLTAWNFKLEMTMQLQDKAEEQKTAEKRG